MNVFDVLLRLLGEYYDVFKVDEGKLPLNAKVGPVHGALKGSRRVAESERHSNKSAKSVVRGEDCFIFVVILDLNLPVSTVSV